MAGKAKKSVQDLHDEIAKKREDLEAAKNAAIEVTADAAEGLEYAALATESARLDAEIALAEKAADPKAMAAGNQANMDKAQAAMDAALGKPPPPPVELETGLSESNTGADATASGTDTGKAGSK